MDSSFRFLKDGCWRKGCDGLEMYSAETGAFFRFKSEHDISLLSKNFVPFRIVIVIKDENKFFEKLWLLTSRTKLMVSAHVDKEFNRNFTNEHNRHSTLILVLTAGDSPVININVFPNGAVTRHYVLRYSQVLKKFVVPDELNIESIATTSNHTLEYGSESAPIHAQLQDNEQSDIRAQCLQLANISPIEHRPSNIAVPDRTNQTAKCKVCFDVHHGPQCQQGYLSNCFECHVTIQNPDDHANSCGVQRWFSSEQVDSYVKIPSVRCVISFQSPMHFLYGGNICEAQAGMGLFSGMSDTYFKFESDRKVLLMTTGYTRIRLPLIVQDGPELFTEKLVFMTSYDRAVVAARASRPVNESTVLDEHEHNTPLVLFALKKPINVSMEVYGAGGKRQLYEIAYGRGNQFVIPPELNILSAKRSLMTFDALPPPKKRM